MVELRLRELEWEFKRVIDANPREVLPTLIPSGSLNGLRRHEQMYLYNKVGKPLVKLARRVWRYEAPSDTSLPREELAIPKLVRDSQQPSPPGSLGKQLLLKHLNDRRLPIFSPLVCPVCQEARKYKLNRCAVCRIVAYCSGRCKQKDMRYHEFYCFPHRWN